MGRRKRNEITPDREKKRIAIILVVGLPALLLTYGYFFYRDEGKLEGTSWVKAPDRAVEWCIAKWNELSAPFYAETGDTEAGGDEIFADGSAGRLGKAPRMYGMEVPLEEHRKLVLKATEGGTLSIPETESPAEEVVEEAPIEVEDPPAQQPEVPPEKHPQEN